MPACLRPITRIREIVMAVRAASGDSSGLDPRLVDRCCVVTGASSGIGRAITLALASAGANVWAVARRRDALQATADEIGCSGTLSPYPADLCFRRGYGGAGEDPLRDCARGGRAGAQRGNYLDGGLGGLVRRGPRPAVSDQCPGSVPPDSGADPVASGKTGPSCLHQPDRGLFGRGRGGPVHVQQASVARRRRRATRRAQISRGSVSQPSTRAGPPHRCRRRYMPGRASRIFPTDCSSRRTWLSWSSTYLPCRGAPR